MFPYYNETLRKNRDRSPISSARAEEKTKHVALLQRDLEEKSRQVTHFQREAEEKTKHVALLQRDLEEKSRQVTVFQRESDQQSQILAQT